MEKSKSKGQLFLRIQEDAKIMVGTRDTAGRVRMDGWINEEGQECIHRYRRKGKDGSINTGGCTGMNPQIQEVVQGWI